MPYSTFFGVYTPTQYALSCKIAKFKFYTNRKNFNYNLGTQRLQENGSEYNLSQKIDNALFYSVFEYTQKLNMLSHVKYRNSKFMLIK